jgi:hypothetical protein
MNLPGFAAEGSLYISAGQYRAAPNGSIFAGQVLPMGTCCSACPSCVYACDPLLGGNSCELCMAGRRICLENCTRCGPFEFCIDGVCRLPGPFPRPR